ncbi:30S ribosomal protein S1 [Synergistes jonesii]|uniref:30S ribosomal protein S1 n=1 Tax=Synergistes jonesii TaxID=2754 RepID=UPI00332B8465
MVDELRTEDAAVENETPEKEETMEEMMQQYPEAMSDIHRGSVVEGTVVDAREDGWLVDVGYKCEGFLPRKEWTHRVLVEETQEPVKDDKVRVQITNMPTGEDSQLGLSRWRCEFDERWNKLEKEAEENETVAVKGLRKVKGGLIVSCCGIEGFIPISHLTQEGHGIAPGKLVDQEFPVKLIEKDRRKRRLVFSRRSLIEEELAGIRQAFYEHVHEGDVLEGDVSSITSFGVFVNLGAMEGLVHITELSWQRSAKAKDIVSKGDHVKVKVIGIDKENNRISLSLRQTLEDPWTTAAERWTPGMVTEGTVTNLTDFGAFVEIEPGVEGLIHIGDLSWTRIKHPKEVLKKGQKVEVSIIETDKERKRISLGYKQLHDPWKNAVEKYPKDAEIPVKVVRLAGFGAFVELEEGVEGLIHISQLSTQRVENPKDVLSEGQEITARVLEVNPGERRIRMSLRPANEEPVRRERPPRDERRGERPADGGEGRRQHDDRPRRPRREGGERRRQENHNSALPQEEMNFSIGDLLKQKESE